MTEHEQDQKHDDDALSAPETPELRVEGFPEGDGPDSDSQGAQSAAEGTPEGDEQHEPADDAERDDEQAEGDTFPRPVVEKLRRENKSLRERAKRSDDLAAALWQARVESLGRLADPTDLPMPEGADPLDVEAVTAAVDDLLSRKPHLASRVPRGDVAQGPSVTGPGFSLTDMIRAHA